MSILSMVRGQTKTLFFIAHTGTDPNDLNARIPLLGAVVRFAMKSKGEDTVYIVRKDSVNDPADVVIAPDQTTPAQDDLGRFSGVLRPVDTNDGATPIATGTYVVSGWYILAGGDEHPAANNISLTVVHEGDDLRNP